MRASLSYDGEAGEFEEELFDAGVVESDSGFGVLTGALYFDDLTPSETLVLDDSAWGDRWTRWVRLTGLS